MSEDFNTGRRLYDIFSEVNNVNPKNHSVVEGWVRIFGIDAEDLTGKEDVAVEQEVARLLSLTDQQLIQLSGELGAKGLDPPVFEDSINNLRNACRARRLHRGQWKYVRENVDGASVKTLEWADQILGGERSTPIEESELQEVAQRLRDLSEKIEERNYPPHLTEYLQSQIRQILQALRDYKIVGLEALDDAIYEAAREEMRYSQEHQPTDEDEKEAAQARRSFWEQVKTVIEWLERAQTTAKAVGLAIRVIGAASGDQTPLPLPPSSDNVA